MAAGDVRASEHESSADPGDATDLGRVLVGLARGTPTSGIARELADAHLPGKLAHDDRVVGVGWATVDTDRAIADALEWMGEAVGGPLPTWEAPTREAVLGATARVVRLHGIALVVLEPDTEARLAAFLARSGEGLCAAYVVGAGPGGMVRPTALGVPGRLRAHAHPWGPYVIAVQPAAGGPDDQDWS